MALTEVNSATLREQTAAAAELDDTISANLPSLRSGGSGGRKGLGNGG